MIPESQAFQLGVAILAAGASRRMGRPKLLLPWGGTTVLGHLVELWRELAAQVAVVHAGGDAPMMAELDRLQISTTDRIANAQPELGMFSSIECAARSTAWSAGLTHWAIVLGDQPLIQRATLRALVDFSAQHPRKICQPRRNGRAKHPVVLPAEAWQELAASEAGTLRGFLHARAEGICFLESEDAGLEVDLDVPEDYERVRE